MYGCEGCSKSFETQGKHNGKRREWKEEIQKRKAIKENVKAKGVTEGVKGSVVGVSHSKERKINCWRKREREKKRGI